MNPKRGIKGRGDAMNHVKRSIVLPVEMAEMLDDLSEKRDVSFTAMLRRIVREWADWRRGYGYVVLPISRPERLLMKKISSEKGVSFRLGALQALRRGLETSQGRGEP